MNIAFCTNFMSFDSLLSCVFGKRTDTDAPRLRKGFSIRMVDSKEQKELCMNLNHTRIWTVDTNLQILTVIKNDPFLPDIFIVKNTKNKHVKDVIHEDVMERYENIIVSAMEYNKAHKHVFNINDINIMMSTYPITDTKNQVVGCNIFENVIKFIPPIT